MQNILSEKGKKDYVYNYNCKKRSQRKDLANLLTIPADGQYKKVRVK